MDWPWFVSRPYQTVSPPDMAPPPPPSLLCDILPRPADSRTRVGTNDSWCPSFAASAAAARRFFAGIKWRSYRRARVGNNLNDIIVDLTGRERFRRFVDDIACFFPLFFFSLDLEGFSFFFFFSLRLEKYCNVRNVVVAFRWYLSYRK